MKDPKNLSKENAELKARLAEAEDLLSAIKSGAVDAFVTDDQKIFTLKGADHAYRVLVETINEGAATLTFDGIVMYGNSRFAAILEVPSQNIIGRSIRDFVSPQDVSRFKSFLKHCENNSGRGEFQFKTNNKKAFPALVSCNALNLDFHGLCIVITDLTGQKRIEVELKNNRDHLEVLIEERTRSLRASEERLRLAQESANVGIWDWNVDSGSLEFTPELNKLYGLPPGTIKTYQDWRERVHSEDISRVEVKRDEAIKKHKPFDLEFRGRHSSGEYRWIVTKGGAIYDEAGKPVRVLGVNIDITGRKQGEERHRLLSETMLQGVVHHDADGKIVAMNPAAERILGKTCEEFLGSSSLKEEHHTIRENGDIFPGTEHPAMVALKTGQHVRGVVTGVYNPGVEGHLWIKVDAVPIFRTGDTKPSEVYAIFEDITARKQADEALHKSEQRFKAIASSTPDHILVQDCNLKYTLVINPQMGLTEQEMVGKTDYDFLKNDEAENLEKIKRKVMETGEAFHLELPLTSPKGEAQFFSGSYVPKYDLAGQISGLIGYFKNITDRKRAEEALVESEKRLQNALRISHSFAFDWDPVSDKVVRSESCGSVLGLSEEEARSDTGKNYFQRLHPEDRDRFVNTLKALKPGINNYLVEYRIMRGDGVMAVLEEMAEASFDEDGKLARLVGTSTDITIRKEAEEILKRDEDTLKMLVKEQAHDLVITQIELERAKRLADIGVLAATVAHELRNPLAAVGLSAYHIKKLINDPRIQEDLSTIDKRISEADQIINNVLSYSKIKAGRFQPTKINDVLKECIDEAQRRFSGQSIAVNVKTDPTEGISIEADPLQMKEVFSNILNNAFDALNKDDGIINIESQVNDSDVAFLINDNGEGIDKENMQKIFDPFFTTKTKGTGLGLAVCNRLVMLYDGSIAIESGKGKGTMVSITLPIRGGG